jgi:hypothetical protein
MLKLAKCGAHAYTSSYLGGWDQEDHSSRPV